MPATKNPTATGPTPAETQRRIRGHAFYPPKAVRAKTPALGATMGVPLAEKTITCKWFVGGHTFYVAEADWATGEVFGQTVTAHGADWGYFNLADLENVRPGVPVQVKRLDGTLFIQGFRWLVERDCHWDAQQVPA